MNYTNFILNYLKQSPKFISIFLVPGFEPVVREESGELRKILDVKLTAKDTKEILITLRNTAAIPRVPTVKEVFSFGMPDIGRIRVSYFLQRGSYVVNIIKTPFVVPEAADIVVSLEKFLDFYRKVSETKYGIFLIIGNRWLSNSMFAYSILKLINKNHKKIICTLENPISFLLRHGNSIVIQRDLSVDVESTVEAIKDMYFLDPDIIYYGSSILSENLPELEYLDMHRLNIISFPFSSYDVFEEKLEKSTSPYFVEIFNKHLIDVINVKQVYFDNEEKIDFEIIPNKSYR